MRAINLMIGVLLAVMGAGLFLCGVAKIREAAARVKCTNNLRQLGLALHNYEGVHKQLPLATIPNPNLPQQRRLSWLLEILPYVEADNIYSRMATKLAWDAEENRFAALLTIPIYHCPSIPDRPPVSTLFPSHYVGVSGLGVDAAELPFEDPTIGCFGYERRLTFADIGGRMDTLLIVSETTRIMDAWTAGGPPTVRGIDVNDTPYLGKNRQFGGMHRHGTNALYADASVHFLRDSLDSQIVKAMVSVHSREETRPLDEP